MENQKLLFEHCNAGKRKYYATNNYDSITIESTMSEDYRTIKVHSFRKYKIVIGFYRYKTEEQLEEEDAISNIAFVPEHEKINFGHVVLYKVSSYNILEYMSDEDVNIHFKHGRPYNIDILSLEEINVIPTAITKSNEKKIFFVKVITTNQQEYAAVFMDDLKYSEELVRLNKKEKIVTNFVVHDVQRRKIIIDNVEMYVTREKKGHFVSFFLHKLPDKTLIGFNISFNNFEIISYFAIKIENLKKIVRDYKKIQKLIIS